MGIDVPKSSDGLRRLQPLRRFNDVFPWHGLKPSIARCVSRRLPRDQGRRLRGGVLSHFALELDLDLPYERDLFLNVYEMAVRDVLRAVLRPGDVFVDGGANLGIFALEASRLVGPRGRVHAFEPQSTMFERLERHRALNPEFGFATHREACWDAAAELQLSTFEGDGPEGASVGRQDRRHAIAGETVRAVRIDDRVAGPLRLLKLDVEGAEFAALRGAEGLIDRARPPHLIIELKTRTAASLGWQPAALVDWILAKVPYRLYELRRRRSVRTDRERLAAVVRARPDKSINVWFRP